MKGGGKIEPPKATAALLSRLGWEDREIHVQTGIGAIDRIAAVFDEGDTIDPDHAREKVTYSTSWSPSPEQGICAHPQRCMRHGFAVVREHDLYQGADAHAFSGTQYQRHLYNYEDPRHDVHGRGFLGFGVVRHWEPERVAETITTYDHTTSSNGVYPFAMRPQRIQHVVALPGGVGRVVKTSFAYELRSLNQGKNHAVFLTDSSSLEWEAPIVVDYMDTAKVHIRFDQPGDRSALRDRHEAAHHDDFGNVLDALTTTVGGVSTHVTATYEIRENDWLIGLLKAQDVTSSDLASSATAVPRHVEHDYEPRGFLCHTYFEKNNPSAEVPEVLTYFHDAEGLVRAVTATAANEPPRTIHTSYEPDERVYANEVWNDLGHAQWSLRHAALGVLLAQADENGVQTHWWYDDLGRTVAVKRDGEAAASMQYSPRFAATIDVVGVHVDVTDETGRSSRVTYDELGRVIARRHAGFDGSSIEQATRYDTLGRVQFVSRPGQGTPASVGITYEYDGLDRTRRELRPGNEIVSYEHGFFETRVIDPMLHERIIQRDVDGRVVASIEDKMTTSYQYGDFGQLVRTTDPQGNQVVVGYDARGRRTFVDDPDAGVTEFHYNGFGDLKWTAANGAHLRTYSYDDIGRLSAILDSDGTTAFKWDGPNGIGRLSHTESPDSTAEDFEYDPLGRLTAETWTVDNKPYRFDYEYDPYGRLQLLKYPEIPGASRFQVRHDYGSTGYLTQVTRAEALSGGGTALYQLWIVGARDADDHLTFATRGNGETVARTYHSDTGRLLNLKDSSSLSVTYGYDFDGNVITRDDNLLDRHESFSYDSIHRLTEWQIASSKVNNDVGYGYDTLGNLTTLTVNGLLKQKNVYGEDQRPHTLTSSYDGAYVYDDRGRQYLAPDRTVAYTEFDLPHAVTTAAGSTSFAYDASHRRVKKVDSSGSNVITLSGLYERRESGGAVKHVFYVQGPDGAIAQAVYNQGDKDPTVEYLHTDPLGSVGAVSDASGTVLERFYYEPFGGRVDASGSSVAGPKKDVFLGFTGDRHDDELGLIDMHGRVYDPGIRRFVTPDPHVTDPLSGQSYNRYSYVVNNPINLTDPTGFDVTGCFGYECLGSGGGFFGFGFSFGSSGRSSAGGTGPSGSPPPTGVFLPPNVASGASPYFMNIPSGGPVTSSVGFRPVSVPVGPSAPATSVMGPPTSPSNTFTVPPPPTGLQEVYRALTGVPVNAPGWRLTNEIFADRLASDGLHNLAGIARSGAACTFCHLTKEYRSLAEADAAIDPSHYEGVVVMMGTTRVFLQTIIMMQAQRGAWLDGPGGGAGAPLSFCFAEGTKVLLADGTTKPIEAIAPGDYVLTDNPSDDSGPRPHRVTARIRTETYRLFHIEVAGSGGGEVLSTGSHPFWTARGWVVAEELTTDDTLLDDTGRGVSIASIAIESRDASTYNLSVEGDHTFFVVAGQRSILVHNVDPWDIWFTHDSVKPVFEHGDLAGRTLQDVAAEARMLGRLPAGLRLEAIQMADGTWAALNNRTLMVARMAGLSDVPVIDLGDAGFNKYSRNLRNADLSGPVENAVIRCK
jgi:RHS repeat-associated protein